MLHNSDEKVIDKNELQKSPISFLTKFFKWKKLCLKSGERNSCGSVYSDKLSRDGEYPAIQQIRIRKHFYSDGYFSIETTKRLSCSVACIPSSVSVRDIISPYPPSPALSMPSRNKNIDHDMEALRLSRQDDPFLKVSTLVMVH